ncbi:MAG: T9SS type A sorting domain-containing protein [Prolixibacteraceae bacterium]|jgi:hypothetical protein|nr:T9SS type A sorting domain-containing protein [Prolixibacteraceae bacterium]
MRHKRFTLLNPTKSVRSNLTRLQLSAVLLLGLGLTGLQAQTSVNATGGNASGSGGSASYSVGQVVYTTHAGTSGLVAQGVQQPYEISVVNGLEEAKSIDLSISAYPNPTTNYLTLEVKDFEFSSLNFQLYDMQGKLLQSEKLNRTETLINMSNYVPSTYFVRVIQGNQSIKEFKIIKTQ